MSTQREYLCSVIDLAEKTDHQSLHDHFKDFGIREAKVMTRGSSGYVSFNDESGMKEAVKRMNNTELDGSTITVTVNSCASSGGSGRRQ